LPQVYLRQCLVFSRGYVFRQVEETLLVKLRKVLLAGNNKALKEFVGRWDEDRVVYSDQSYFCWNGGGADTENAARMLEKWIQWLRNWTLRTKRTILPLSIAHEFWNSICVEYDGIIGIQGRYT
jgi:hypothetical protein